MQYNHYWFSKSMNEQKMEKIDAHFGKYPDKPIWNPG